MAFELFVDFSAGFDPGDVFILDDPVKGVLDGATYVLGPGVGADPETDIGEYCDEFTITRGRSRQLDVFQPGSAVFVLENIGREFDPSYAAGPFYGHILPGRRIVAIVDGVTVFSGAVADWNFEYDPNAKPRATIIAEDALAQLARAEFDAWTTIDGQTAGPRITSVLDRPEVDFGPNRVIGTGVSTLQDDSVTHGSNVLNYLQLVAQSDLGRLFASASNELTFLDRHATLDSEPSVRFSDDATGIGVESFRTEYGSEQLFNRVGIDRETGTLQTAVDTASASKYGPRSLTRTGLLMDSDTQSLLMSAFLVGIYAEPEQRVSGVTLAVFPMTAADQGAVLSLDLGSTVEVEFTPADVVPPVQQLCIVEGIRHQHRFASHTMELTLGASEQRNVFVFDDSVWGLMDTGGVLAF